MAALNSGEDGSRLPPAVLIDRGADAPGFDTVRADCEAGGYAAARHLIGLGHRDIAILAHSKRLENIEQRIAGCRRALGEAGLMERDRVIYGGHDLESLRGAIELELHRVDPSDRDLRPHQCLRAGLDQGRARPRPRNPRRRLDCRLRRLRLDVALRPYLTTIASRSRISPPPPGAC